MSGPLLTVKQLCKSFGGVVATDNLDFDVMPGEIHAVIGPNGAGKTTFVAQIAGMLRSDSGSIIFDGQDIAGKTAPERSHIGLARSFQITSVFRDFTALENVALSIQAHSGHSFKFWKRASTDTDLTAPAQKILDDVGLGDKALSLAGNLAHGQQRQLEIAMALATSPKMLLLDEPTAGINPTLINGIIDRLIKVNQDFGITLLVIEHNMRVIMQLAENIFCLAHGKMLAKGSPDEIKNDKRVIDAYLGAQ